MNYKRVYAEFIKDRLGKQPAAPIYFERHHISPRCLGGGDEPENLISLTPEDHYFAHLLLAKIHGGKLWAAIFAMRYLVRSEEASYRESLSTRIRFGHIRRSLAKYYRSIMGGPDGHIADKKKHELRHLDGRIVLGNRFELSALTGVSRPQISSVLRGAKKTAHGWYHVKHNPDGISRSQRLHDLKTCKKMHVLFHHDGREWTGTRFQFNEEFGAQLTFQHGEGSVVGWYRTKDQAGNHGALRKQALRSALSGRGNIGGANNPNADFTKYNFKILSTGEVICATKVEIRRRLPVSSADLCGLFNGKQKTTKGLCLADAR